MNKKVLVAGGAGFIGSHLCKSLLDSGIQVVSLDNLSTGNKDNIAQLLENENFHFVEADTCDSNLPNKLSDRRFDELYDLASPASVTYIMEHPLETAQANSIGTRNLLEIAKKNKAKFLFASSSETYGDPKEHPQKESYWGNVNPVGVRSGYDEGKRFGEALCMAYYRQLDLPVRIVRIFNTYGPNSSPKDTRVIPQFVTQAIQNKPLQIHGNGKQTRSFCYVSDLVDGMIKMMESSEIGPINLGNPDEFTVLSVAKKIIEMTGSSSEIAYVQRPQDDPSRRKPDVSFAKEKLQWEPKMSLKEGLTRTIAYFRDVFGEKHGEYS